MLCNPYSGYQVLYPSSTAASSRTNTLHLDPLYTDAGKCKYAATVPVVPDDVLGPIHCPVPEKPLSVPAQALEAVISFSCNMAAVQIARTSPQLQGDPAAGLRYAYAAQMHL